MNWKTETFRLLASVLVVIHTDHYKILYNTCFKVIYACVASRLTRANQCSLPRISLENYSRISRIANCNELWFWRTLNTWHKAYNWKYWLWPMQSLTVSHSTFFSSPWHQKSTRVPFPNVIIFFLWTLARHGGSVLRWAGINSRDSRVFFVCFCSNRKPMHNKAHFFFSLQTNPESLVSERDLFWYRIH